MRDAQITVVFGHVLNLSADTVMYRKISNTIRTLVQYAFITGEPWENVSLVVQYAPVLCHPSLSPSMPSMPLATSTKGVSCSVAGAGKVTLIGSNCPASRVGRNVDCEGGRTAQIFSDWAITKYLSHATAFTVNKHIDPPGKPGNYCQLVSLCLLRLRCTRLPLSMSRTAYTALMATATGGIVQVRIVQVCVLYSRFFG